jgi:hypothetical protein
LSLLPAADRRRVLVRFAALRFVVLRFAVLRLRLLPLRVDFEPPDLLAI